MARVWLVKSEPDAYAYDDLERDGRTAWEGVRNYQARNFMRDEMREGDAVLYYHSSTDAPGVVGVATVASAPYPDPTQFDEASPYYDPKSTPDAPRWVLVDIAPLRRLPRVVTLQELKADARFEGSLLTHRGTRLSVMPMDEAHLRAVEEMAQRAPAD
ncbi:MAG: EVE domain-containing protein [Trueperaceae bacterium]